VVRTRVGYAGGTTPDPTYRRLGDHSECVEVDYDAGVVSYEDLLAVFWSSHDPREPAYSRQYRSAILVRDDEQRAAAELSLALVGARLGPVSTAVEPLQRFYRAEDYHQKYRLRAHDRVAAEFRALLPDERAFVDSTAAARLNGWLDGWGSAAQVERELTLTGLPRSAQDTVRRSALRREHTGRGLR
jgi:peptide-methionine (S)-S-oxide reductase